ncbi:pentapeptide repeat-containing protein [Paludisphaera rhizosphaerae]|uniref:pentapeptide repeat-containing protein n=1 Tax=Paludisphaera rhizosphaerae TaxID=2711216 RepID=UPI0013ECA9F8|nr:pentapeptide repeat-containing protein [Paludisphaera rhizosphaerae]
MAIHTLSRRWRTGPLAVVQAESLSRAVELTAGAGVPLAYADLPGIQAPRASLTGVDLRGADLTGADLREADLKAADLRGADLRNADLRGADLRNARFPKADLRGVRLTGARLDGAVLDWRSAAFAVELLRRDPGCRGEALTLAFELALEADDRPYAWLRAIVARRGLVDWAASVLGRAIVPGDDAPEILRKLAADVEPETTSPPSVQPTGSLYWTRRR